MVCVFVGHADEYSEIEQIVKGVLSNNKGWIRYEPKNEPLLKNGWEIAHHFRNDNPQLDGYFFWRPDDSDILVHTLGIEKTETKDNGNYFVRINFRSNGPMDVTEIQTQKLDETYRELHEKLPEAKVNKIRSMKFGEPTCKRI